MNHAPRYRDGHSLKPGNADELRSKHEELDRGSDTIHKTLLDTLTQRPPHGCPLTSHMNLEQRKNWKPMANAELYGMRSDASRRKVLPILDEREQRRSSWCNSCGSRARPRAEDTHNLDRHWSQT